jgi:hypothetical protein
MRALAVVLALSWGCTQAQARGAHRAGEVATAGGLIGILVSVTTASLLPAHENTLITIGIAFVPVTVLGALVFIGTDQIAHQDAGPNLSRRDRHRATAWELTKQAASAARSEDCTQVQAIAPRVRDLDGDFHGSVFLRDAAIQRCLRER